MQRVRRIALNPCSLRVGATAFAAMILIGGAGCKKSEPEPTAPGYYTGPIKPKGEVAPPGGGPAGGAKKPGAALGEADK